MWHDLLVATALMLVIEGIIPFASPTLLRHMLLQMEQVDDRTLRLGGLTSMVVGVVLLYVAR